MSTATMTTIADILKEHYDGQQVTDLTYPDNPFFALCPKMTTWVGKNHRLPVCYGPGGGLGSTFSTAQGDVTGASFAHFALTKSNDYYIAQIDTDAIDFSSDGGGFESVLAEIDIGMQALIRNCAMKMYGAGQGARAQIAATGLTSGSANIQLKYDEDTVHMMKNMVLCAAGTETATSAKNSSSVVNEYTILAINRATGVLSGSTNGGAPGLNGFTAQGWDNEDWLFLSSDIGCGFYGLKAWIPSTTPSSGDSFFGEDRSVDSFLYGLYYTDLTTVSIDDAIQIGIDRAIGAGGRPTHCFLNPTNFNKLIRTIGTSRVINATNVTPTIGYRTIEFMGSTGPVKVIGDRNCPVTDAFIIEMPSWKLYSNKSIPHIVMHGADAKGMSTVYNADAVEVRLTYRAQLGCTAPGRQVRVALNAS